MRSLDDATIAVRPRSASRPRRVLHVCPYMHPFAGGPPVVVERLSRHAAAFGWNASVLTTSFMCPDDGRSLAADLGRDLDIEVLPVDRPRIMGHASRAGAALDDAIRQADIVHIHTLWHPLNVLARRGCRRHDKPYVLSPHGMLDPNSMSVHAWRKRAYLALIEARNLANAARIVFTTETERDLARPALRGRGRTEVVSIGSDEPPPLPREDLGAKFLAAYPGGRDGSRILFLSRLHPKKGLERLLEAMASIATSRDAAHLFVAGSGSREYEASLRRHSENLGIAHRVTFTGFLSNEVKWSAMAAADIFVLPSRQENFAIAVAEAMQAGLPVVVSRAVNLSSAISASGAGIIVDDENDVPALAGAIGKLMDDPDICREVGDKARNLALEKFGWPDAAKDSFALYETVLCEARVGPRDSTSLEFPGGE